MDQFNKIEIQGMVGAVRVTNFTYGSLANISVATNYLHRTRDNQATVETTWFNVLGRIGRAIAKADSVAKGDAVHIIGRVRTKTFTDSEGNERLLNDVIASKIERIDTDVPLQCGVL